MKPGQKTLLNILFYHRFKYRLLILCFSFLAAFSGLAVPYFQKQFSETLNLNTLWICLAISFAYLVLNQMTLLLGQHESIKAQKKLAETIYQHHISLHPLTLQNKSVGEVISIYSTDIPSLTVWLEQSLPYGLTTLFPLILTPLFLYYFYELELNLSYGLILILISINGLMAYRQSIYFFKFKKLAADRMGLVNEWIQNIRGLKILNWVEGFEDKIIRKRREETQNRVSMVTNGQIMNSFSSSINFWLNISILAFFIWGIDKKLTAADFISLSWMTTVFLSKPLRQLPWFFTFVFDAWTSYKRLAEFLNLKNLDYLIKQNTTENQNCYLDIKNLNLHINTKRILSRVDLQIQPGELVALIGPVGSGKSLLMKSIIGETPFTADVFFKNKISYVPQEHFIMSASLRDNITFQYQSTSETDSLIQHALKMAQFDFKLDRVQEGLDTFIGERGVNLSGGQKQRVNLARQFMYPQKLILLDDPLSAVDVATEKKLITELKNLINTGASILLTTQRFSILPSCDRIIYLVNGEIQYDGDAQAFLHKDKYQVFITGLESELR